MTVKSDKPQICTCENCFYFELDNGGDLYCHFHNQYVDVISDTLCTINGVCREYFAFLDAVVLVENEKKKNIKEKL